MRQNFSLSAKINMIITAAVMIPLLIVSLLMFSTIRRIALDNLETLMLENGSRREAAIESDLREALTLINEYLANNQEFLLLSIEEQDSGLQNASVEEIQSRVETDFTTQLLNSSFFNSVRLLNRQYFPYATGVRSGQTAQGIFESQRNAVAEIAQRLQTTPDETRAFGITNRDGEAQIEVLIALLAEDDEGNLEVGGYLLIDLNLETIFYENLTESTNQLDAYAYVLVERDDERILLASPEVFAGNLIDANSFGVERALSNRAGDVDIYSVNTDTGTREVVGYSSTMLIDSQAFALVSETNTSTLFEGIRQQTIGQVFVIGIVVTVIILILGLLLANQLVLPPIRNLRSAILAVIRGDFEAPVHATERNDEIGSLATSFVDMREYIRDLTDDMNRRLQERTRDVQVTQEIAKAVTAERDLPTLMSRVVTLIAENFPAIYHAQIFMIDEERKFAVLRASTGAAGRELMARGHKLGVGSVSVIGQVTEQGQVIIARDTAESNLHRQNEFLGDTRAELAIPLRSGGVIIGALDVQSKQRDSFDPDQVLALQTLADQITIAIENTRLYSQSESLLQEAEAKRSQTTRQAWQQYLRQQRQSDISISEGASTGYNFQRLTSAVMKSGEPVVGEATNRDTIPFVVPIKLRGQILGVVEYEIPKVDFEYDKVLLAQEMVSRLAISLENARLFQASQQATKRERIVNEISTRLTSQTDIESILQTAVREIEQALRTPRVGIRLTSMSGTNGNGNGAAHSNGNNPENTSQ